jgi:hypothetical protein
MFESRKGKRKFDACALKRVEYIEQVGVIRQGVRISIPVSSLQVGEDANSSKGVKPILTCPKLDELGLSIYSDREREPYGYGEKTNALENIRAIAGKTVCASCELAGMTATQVADRRREVAEAEARALIAEANLNALQSKVAAGDTIIQDLPPDGGLYPQV